MIFESNKIFLSDDVDSLLTFIKKKLDPFNIFCLQEFQDIKYQLLQSNPVLEGDLIFIHKKLDSVACIDTYNRVESTKMWTKQRYWPGDMKVQSRKYIDTIVQKLKDMNIAFERLVVKSRRSLSV